MQECVQRRRQLLRCLCSRRYDTIPNLAAEFCVSERTIQRDISVLSLTEPIYTQAGRHSGGVYMLGYSGQNKFHMLKNESSALQNIFHCIMRHEADQCRAEDLMTFQHVIRKYTRPQSEAAEEKFSDGF